MNIRMKLHPLLISPVFISLLLVFTTSSCVGSRHHVQVDDQHATHATAKAAKPAPSAPAAAAEQPAGSSPAAEAAPAIEAAPVASAEKDASVKSMISLLKRLQDRIKIKRVAV